MMKLERLSFGMGDRFGYQGKAQLQAIIQAKETGIDIVPIWNKSFREHQFVHTSPDAVREEADAAVEALGWTGSYFVDADHIGLNNVDHFIPSSDFYILDVADFTGKAASAQDTEAFMSKFSEYTGTLEIPGIEAAFKIDRERLWAIADKYLLAVKEAGRIYRHIESAKGRGNFITEVSMDETDDPQTAVELFFILAAVSEEGIPAQTIAPKFTGRFNKGVDYVGDVIQFEKEFNDDLAVIAFAIKAFGLPDNLKLSVHSGSDKFSIYKPIGDAIRLTGAGVHVKTAGTTWLEELIGLAEAGGEGLLIAKEVYRKALDRMVELCEPYSAVIDIESSKLPGVEEVNAWDGKRFAASLRHDQTCDAYNMHFRQLLHIGFKIAADMGDRYLNALKEYEAVIAKHVSENLFERHIKRLFMTDQAEFSQ
ncbi:MAG: hypothetical protein H8E81_08040 [Deltaproteobacteria bacterium]|nr:hypothetical protein [Deltaproteobacteria bacterium]